MIKMVPPQRPEGRGLLNGKTILITAAAGTGIGFAIAERAVDEGAQVMISDIHEQRLLTAAEKLSKKSGKTILNKLCNVTKEDQVKALVDSAVKKMGHVDILVNNAGLGGTDNIVEMTDEQWYAVIETSLTGTFRMMRAMLKHMTARKHGVIVNNASVLGWRAQSGQAHYAASKAGVMALTRCAAVEVARSGIRINAVAPSLAMHEFLNKVTSEELLLKLKSREAFGRAAETWEIANVVAFLASDYSTYMTGEVISVSSQRA